MYAEKFNIVFDGTLREGVTLDEARANVAKLYGSDQAHVASLLFSGKRSILKRDLSAEKADKILAVLKSAGLLATKEAVAPTFSLQEEAPPASTPHSTPPASTSPSTFSLLEDALSPSGGCERPEKTEAGNKGALSGEGWMGSPMQGTNAGNKTAEAAVMTTYGRGNEMDSTPKARPQPSASAMDYASDMGGETERFAELSLFSFEGRLGRLRYFVWPMIPWLIFFSIVMVGAVLPMLDSVIEHGSLDSALANIAIMKLLFLFVLSVPFLVFGISVTVRRLHDLNLSGWWFLGLVLIGVIPFLGNLVNFLAWLAFLFWPGSAGENDYGSPPPPNPNSLYTVMIAAFVLSGVLGGYMGYSMASKIAPIKQRQAEAGRNMTEEEKMKQLQQMVEEMQKRAKEGQR
ncbi:MAG: DUF805 domain-containing protein [Betaproteobacteria bacterium]|nr:DUF805 domain-containing protein [Betaproteobacteria bacterium]